MRNSKYQLYSVVIAGSLVLLSLSWSSAPLAETPGKVLALQFSRDVVDPEQPQFIDDLSSYVGAPLRYVKPVTGGEHLFQLVKPLPKRQMRKLVSRLEKHQQVKQVKIDQ